MTSSPGSLYEKLQKLHQPDEIFRAHIISMEPELNSLKAFYFISDFNSSIEADRTMGFSSYLIETRSAIQYRNTTY